MPTPRKLPSGRWNVQVYIGEDANGKPIRKSITADSKRECALKAAQVAMSKQYSTPANTTVKKALESYLEQCRALGYSPTTLMGYTAVVNNGFTPELMATRLRSITVPMIQKSINARAMQVSAKTVKNEVYMLLPALKTAGLKIDPEEFVLPKANKKDITIPEDDDVIRLLSYCRGHNRNVYLGVLLAALLGLRRSEVCALQWTDIDFEHHSITINKALVRGADGYTLKGTKTDKSNRTIPVPDSLLAILKAYRGIGPVITETYAGFGTSFIRVCEKCDFKYNFHALRHYRVSVNQALNVPVLYTMSYVGHSTPTTTEQVYSHVMRHQTQIVNETISAHADALMQKCEQKCE